MRHLKRPTIGLVFVCWLVAALTAAGSAAASAELDRALDVLDRLEHQRINASFNQTSLEFAVESIGRQIDIPLRAEWDQLRRMGIRASDEFSLELGETSAATAISALVMMLADDFERPVYDVHASQIVITVPQATVPMRLTAAYDVRDLLTDGHTVDALTDSLVPPGDPTALDATPTGGDELDDDEPELKIIPRSPAVDLLYMIMEHVDPDAWMDFGGTSGRISEREGAVVVTAVPTTHRRLRETLRALRQANPRGVTIDATIVSIESSDLERLRRRYEPGSPSLARAMVREGSTLWRAESAVGFGSTYTARATSPATPAIPATPATEVEVEITPTFDAARGLLTLAVTASCRRAEGRSEVSTTVELASVRAAAVLELPPATLGSRRQMLVLIPTRQ